MDNEDVIVPFCDWALAEFAWYANRGGIEFGVTLQIGGQIVSGTTVSGAEFLKDVGEKLSEVITNSGDQFKELSDTIKGKYKDQAQKLYPKISSQESNEAKGEQFSIKSAFIHLKNVDIWTDSASKSLPVRYWRGKLASVDAWFIGRMSIG